MIDRLVHFFRVYRNKKRQCFASVVPEGSVRNLALTVVVGIMTFLSSLTLGGVNLIQEAAKSWQNQVLREATIQILPIEGQDMEKALEEAVIIAGSFGGIADARIVSREATAKLLEPWLGSGFDMDALPVPRLIILTLHAGSLPDFEGLRDALRQNIPSAHFDDHRMWADRLVLMAQGMVTGGVLVFLLVLTSMILTIIFATRGALSSNAHIVEVLHFIGADSGFIARQFDRYFFLTGLRGAFAGSVGTLVIFLVVPVWMSGSQTTSLQDSQMRVLFGDFSGGWIHMAELFVLVLFVSVLTMLASHYTVVCQLQKIDKREGDFFSRAG